jgi:hypothetical protein
VAISEKSLRIHLNHLNHEPGSGICPICRIQACREGTGETPNTNTSFIIANWIRERQSWGPGRAFDGGVDVCCCFGRGHVTADDIEESDVLGIVSLMLKSDHR